jgi:hypothetical protein
MTERSWREGTVLTTPNRVCSSSLILVRCLNPFFRRDYGYSRVFLKVPTHQLVPPTPRYCTHQLVPPTPRYCTLYTPAGSTHTQVLDTVHTSWFHPHPGTVHCTHQLVPPTPRYCTLYTPAGSTHTQVLNLHLLLFNINNLLLMPDAYFVAPPLHSSQLFIHAFHAVNMSVQSMLKKRTLMIVTYFPLFLTYREEYE